MSDGVDVGTVTTTIEAEDKYSQALDHFVQRLDTVEQKLTSASTAVDQFTNQSAEKFTELNARSATALDELTNRLRDPRNEFQKLTDTVSANVSSMMPHLDHLKEGIVDSIEHPMEFAKGAAIGFVEVLGPVGIAIGAVAAIATVAGKELWDLGERASVIGGHINDMSEKMSLSAERTSSLKYAMDVAGGSIDQASNLIFMMQRRMADSPKNFEEGLKKIGLSIKEIQDLQPDQKLYAISKAFQENTDQTNRASVAMDLFSRAGREAIPLLMKDLGGLAEESKNLGDIWSDKDAAAAEQLEMASNRLNAQWEAMKTSLGRDLIPVMKDFLDVANVAVSKTREWVPYVEHLIDEQLGLSAALMILGNNPFFGWLTGAGKNELTLPKIKPITKEDLGINAFDVYLKSLTESQVQTSALEAHIRSLTKAEEPLTVAQQALAEKMLKGKDSVEEIAKWLGVSEKAVSAFKESTDKATKASESAIKAHEHVIEVLGKMERAGYQDSTAMSVMAESLTKVGQKDDSVQLISKAFDEVTKSVQRALDKIHQIISIKWPSDLHDMLAAMGVMGQGVLPSTRVTVPPGGGILPGGSPTNPAAVQMVSQTSKALDSLNELSRAWSHFSQVADGALGTVVRDIGSAITGTSLFTTAVHSMSDHIGTDGKMIKATFADIASGMMTIWGLALQYGPQIADALGKAFHVSNPFMQNANAGITTITQFESQFSSFDVMKKKVEEAFVAMGKSTHDADVALAEMFAAASKGGDAAAAAIKKIQDALDAAAKSADLLAEASSKYGPSSDDLAKAEKHAHDLFDAMVKAGSYSQEQLNKAYYDWQKAMADAGNEAAKAWVKAHDAVTAGAKVADEAMQKLMSRRDELSKSIDAEAPEEHMGVIEQRQRAERDAINAQIKEAEDAAKRSEEAQKHAAEEGAKAYEQRGKEWTDDWDYRGGVLTDHLNTLFQGSADGVQDHFIESGKNAAAGIEERFSKVHIVIPIDFDVHSPDLPRGTGGGSRDRSEAEGDFGFAQGPMTFTTQGDEFVAFGGEHKGLQGLQEQLGGAPAAPATKTVIQIFPGTKYMKEIVIDELERYTTDRDIKVLKLDR